MAQYSLHVELEGVSSFSTQMQAKNVPSVVRLVLEGKAIADVLEALPTWPQCFTERDIFLLIPMTGLINMYLCQLGRDGKYVSITISRTVSRQIRELG